MMMIRLGEGNQEGRGEREGERGEEAGEGERRDANCLAEDFDVGLQM